MPLSIGPTIGVKGEKAFRSAFQEMIAQGSRLKTEMDQLTQSFSKNDTAEQRLSATTQQLAKQYQTQERTVDQANQMVVRSMDSISRATKLYEAQKQKVEDLTKTHEEHTQILENIVNNYAETEDCVKLAREEWAAEEAELKKENKTLDEREAAVYKQQATTEKWSEVLASNTAKLEQMRKELVKGADYVEEFGRKTESAKDRVERYEKQIEVLDSELELSRSAHTKWSEALKRSGEESDILKRKISEEYKVLAENSKLREEAVKTEEKQRKEYERLATELERAKRLYGEDSDEVRILNDAVDEQAKLVHEASMNTADYTQKVNESRTALNQFNEELKNSSGFKAIGQMMSDAGEKMEQFGSLMSKYVTTPLAGLGAYAVKSAADFQDGMAKIYTIAIDGAEPMEKMQKELVQLSNETGFDLEDLAEATYQTVSASVDATDAVEFMTKATKLSRAGFTSTTKAVDVLTTIMNSYGKEAYDVEYISDVLLKTQNDGKLIIDELASSLGIIIPMASNYNVGLEQIAAAYATMTKQGVPAAKATTFLRAVFTELEKESSDVAGILDEKTGKSFAQLMGEGKNLSEVLKILYDYAGQDAEKFQRLFGNVRSTQAVAALVTGDFSILNSELKRVKDSAGQTDNALAVMETPALKARRAVNRLKNSAEDLGETIIDMVLPAFEKATDKVTELTEGFLNLSDDSKKLIVKNAALAASIGPVLVVVGKITKYIGTLLMGTGSFIPLIAGVTAGFIALATAAQVAAIEERAFREQQYGLTEEAKTTIARIDELKQAHEEFKVSMQGETTEVLNNTEKIKQLVAQYDALVGSNGKVKEGSEKLADVLIGEIASALGITKEEVQQLIDKHGKLSESISKTIEDYKKEALVAVYVQQLNEATERLVESQSIAKDLADSEDEAYRRLRDSAHQLQVAKDAIREAEEKGLPVTDEMYQALADATTNYNIAEIAVNDLKTAITENNVAMQDAEDDITKYGDMIAETGDKAEKSSEKTKKAAKESEEAIKTSKDNVVRALSDAKTSAYNSGANVARGFAKGIEDYAYLSSSAASTMGANASKLLKTTLHEKSPSKVTREYGKYFSEGFALGIESGIPMANKMAEQLGMGATDALTFGSYVPEGMMAGNTWNTTKTVNAPISVNVTVEGSVDDPDSFARDIANRLTNLINRESEVFA